MLEFTDVFPKGYSMSYNTNKLKMGSMKETVMKCKNIDFGHVSWVLECDNIEYMVHIIDNIIDVNVNDNNCEAYYSFFNKIMRFSTTPYIIHYMLNNGYINNKSFNDYYDCLRFTGRPIFCKCCPHKEFDKLTNYLTEVSFNRFKGYYNIEKYYDMAYIVLLILKVQSKNLPSTIIKHLIIPFIYQ